MKPDLHTKPLVPHGWLRAMICVLVYFMLLITAGILATWYNAHAVTGATTLVNNPGKAYLPLIINGALGLAIVWLFRKLVDRRPVSSLGLSLAGNAVHGGTGFFLGIFLLCAGSCILYVTGSLEWTDVRFSGNDLFLSFGLMAIVAFSEEIVFRGYVLQNLAASLPGWIALVVSALLFTIAHLSNRELTVTGTCTIFLTGVLFGINYLFTRNLWFAIMLHFTWNFVQGPLLGFPVSGLPMEGLLQHSVTGNSLINGGNFGFEGSLVAVLLSAATIPVLVLIYRHNARQATEG
jgi:membrane protease YdiL (CAAX protease family)